MIYSQTILQLYKQLDHNGYEKSDKELIFLAHKLAIELSSGLIRPSGKTHISHLIGTASVLAHMKVNIELVAAGLLHSIYSLGDFGYGPSGINIMKRDYVKNAVNKRVEDYVYRYSIVKWSENNYISRIHHEIEQYDGILKNVVLLRLADIADELIDSGIMFCPNAEVRISGYKKNIPTLIDIANKMGYKEMGDQLSELLEQNLNTTITAEIRQSPGTNRTRLIPPRSYQKKFHVVTIQMAKVAYLNSKMIIQRTVRFTKRQIVKRIQFRNNEN